RPETEHPDIAERDRPRKQERDLKVEDDEQDRDQIIAHVEPYPRILERLEPALIRRQLLGIGLLAGDDERRPDHHEREPAGDDEEDQDREVFAQQAIHRELSSALREPLSANRAFVGRAPSQARADALFSHDRMAGATGLEPAASGVT